MQVKGIFFLYRKMEVLDLFDIGENQIGIYYKAVTILMVLHGMIALPRFSAKIFSEKDSLSIPDNLPIVEFSSFTCLFRFLWKNSYRTIELGFEGSDGFVSGRFLPGGFVSGLHDFES